MPVETSLGSKAGLTSNMTTAIRATATEKAATDIVAHCRLLLAVEKENTVIRATRSPRIIRPDNQTIRTTGAKTSPAAMITANTTSAAATTRYEEPACRQSSSSSWDMTRLAAVIDNDSSIANGHIMSWSLLASDEYRPGL